MAIATGVRPASQQHFEDDRDGQHTLFPRRKGDGWSHIVDATEQPITYIGAGFPAGVVAQLYVSPDRVNWTPWLIHSQHVLVSEEHPLQWVNFSGHFRFRLMQRNTTTCVLEPYSGAVQPTLRWYPATTTHERNWNLTSQEDDCMACLTAAQIIAALSAATPTQQALFCQLFNCTPAAFTQPMASGVAPPTSAPLAGQSPFYLHTGVNPNVLYVWNGASWVPATNFSALITSAVSGATDTARGVVSLNLGTSLGDATNSTDALTAAGLQALIAAGNFVTQGPVGPAGPAGPVGPVGPPSPNVLPATDTAQGVSALNLGTSPGDPINSSDALTASGLNHLMWNGLAGFRSNTPTATGSVAAGFGLTLDGFGGAFVDFPLSTTLQPGLYVCNWSADISRKYAVGGLQTISADVRTPALSGSNIEGQLVRSVESGALYLPNSGVYGVVETGSGVLAIQAPTSTLRFYVYSASPGAFPPFSFVSAGLSALPLSVDLHRI